MSRARGTILALALAAVCGPAWAGLDDDDDGPDYLLVSPRTRPAVTVGFGAPLGAAAGFELMHGLGAHIEDDGEVVKGVAGLVLQVHGGTGGGKLSLGAGARAHVRSEEFIGSMFAAFKLSLARTWGTPIGTTKELTYFGPELELSALHFNVGLGVLARVGGNGGNGV